MLPSLIASSTPVIVTVCATSQFADVKVTLAGIEADGRIAWRVSVTPYIPPDANPDLERASETMPTRLYRVSVDVRFPGATGSERSLLLTTVKLGPRNPA